MLCNTNSTVAIEPGLRRGILILAIVASSLSVAISIVAGWQRGGTEIARLLMASVGFVAVLGAHLLPAFCRRVPILTRVIGAMIWLICFTFVAYGHASFFLLAQDQAGAQRAAALVPAQQTPQSTPKRVLSVVLADEAKVKGWQAADSLAKCADNCGALKVREAVFKARIAALDAETDEIWRWQQAQEKAQSRRDELRDDAVTTPLATSLGVTGKLANLVTGGIFSLILEGLGCFCWYLVFLRNGAMAVTRSVTPGVTQAVTHDSVDTARSISPRSEEDELVANVRIEIDAGRLKCTVDSIRKYLHCGQDKARKVRGIISDASVNLASSDVLTRVSL
jgi:hypothetical protein